MTFGFFDNLWNCMRMYWEPVGIYKFVWIRSKGAIPEFSLFARTSKSLNSGFPTLRKDIETFELRISYFSQGHRTVWIPDFALFARTSNKFEFRSSNLPRAQKLISSNKLIPEFKLLKLRCSFLTSKRQRPISERRRPYLYLGGGRYLIVSENMCVLFCFVIGSWSSWQGDLHNLIRAEFVGGYGNAPITRSIHFLDKIYKYRWSGPSRMMEKAHTSRLIWIQKRNDICIYIYIARACVGIKLLL